MVKRSRCSPKPTSIFEVLKVVAGISTALGFVAGAFKTLEFVTDILKAQSSRLQHLPAKHPYMERLLKKGHKVLSLPKPTQSSFQQIKVVSCLVQDSYQLATVKILDKVVPSPPDFSPSCSAASPGPSRTERRPLPASSRTPAPG